VSLSRWVSNGPVKLHYLDTDGGDTDEDERAPIVFIPGLTDNVADYAPIIGDFGRRVIVVELRGRGLSDTPDDGYALADHAGDIAAVVNAVTSGPVHLMAFSRGTCYALEWASENPERVLSMSIGDYPAREVVLPDGFYDGFMASNWRGTPVADRISPVAVSGIARESVGRPFWEELAGWDIPVLVVRSASGGPVTDEDWERYRTDLPGAKLVTFHDSPHDIFRPERMSYPLLVLENIARAE
jgi:non-heme chloroperoxidase